MGRRKAFLGVRVTPDLSCSLGSEGSRQVMSQGLFCPSLREFIGKRGSFAGDRYFILMIKTNKVPCL
jgi:hypothetical protein